MRRAWTPRSPALLNLPDVQPDLSHWDDLLHRIRNPKGSVRIAIVGKYVEFKESYKSLTEALHHAGYGLETQVDLKWVEGEEIDAASAASKLSDCHGILVPGGFGVRGTHGMIEAARYAREQKIPFFGICLGMQMASVEFARHVAGLEGADSTEFEENPKHRIIFKLRELVDVEELGRQPCAWGPIPACSAATAARRRPTVPRRSASAIATGTSSTRRSTAGLSKRRGWLSRG